MCSHKHNFKLWEILHFSEHSSLLLVAFGSGADSLNPELEMTEIQFSILFSVWVYLQFIPSLRAKRSELPMSSWMPRSSANPISFIETELPTSPLSFMGLTAHHSLYPEPDCVFFQLLCLLHSRVPRKDLHVWVIAALLLPVGPLAFFCELSGSPVSSGGWSGLVFLTVYSVILRKRA